MNKIYFNSCFLVIGLLVVFGCKSSKSLTSGQANLGLSLKEVIKENSKRKADFKTLQSKVKVSYTTDDKSQTHTLTVRILKDEIIWVNSALNLIRAKITPDSVSFYNKLDNTYFDGDFRYLSEILGTELDFEKVQNLLIGEAIFQVNKSDYDMSVHEAAYLVQPKNQLPLFELFYIINAAHFKIDSQQLAQSEAARFLQVDYLKYQEVEKQQLPETLKIIVLEGDDETIIEIEFKAISLNEDLRYPFKIPTGFDEIILK